MLYTIDGTNNARVSSHSAGYGSRAGCQITRLIARHALHTGANTDPLLGADRDIDAGDDDNAAAADDDAAAADDDDIV